MLPHSSFFVRRSRAYRYVHDDEASVLHITWRTAEVHVTAKDTWLGPTLNLGGIGAMYNLTMDPYEKYDMVFNGTVATQGGHGGLNPCGGLDANL
jgi:hypothetical protein